MLQDVTSHAKTQFSIKQRLQTSFIELKMDIAYFKQLVEVIVLGDMTTCIASIQVDIQELFMSSTMQYKQDSDHHSMD